MAYFWVMLGGALGSGARFAITRFFAERAAASTPWATLGINVAGSFLITVFAGIGTDRALGSPAGRLFLMAGICGGFTTFSSFSYQTLLLARDGQRGLALLNVAASVILCLLAAWAGMWVSARWSGGTAGT